MAKWSKERQAWYDMVRGCHDPRRKLFQQLYGPMGIQVCPEWRTSYALFFNDVGPAPSPEHWLCRPNVRGNFEPGNCEWTNVEVQMRRRTCCKTVSINGQAMTPAEASRLPGMPVQSTIGYRIANGMWSDNPPAKRLLPKAHWITYQGQTLPGYEWARRLGLKPETVRMRLKRGMPVEQVLHTGHLQKHKPRSAPTSANIGQLAAKAAQKQQK